MPENTYTEEDILNAVKAAEELNDEIVDLDELASQYNVDTNEVIENAMAVDPVAIAQVGDSTLGELAERYDVNINDANDSIVTEGTDEVVEVTEQVNNSDLAVGDIVTLSPELADNVPNYDPSDEYRVIDIDNGLVSLSRNGVEDDNLSYIPVENLTKYNYVMPEIAAYENSVGSNNGDNETTGEYEDVYSDSSMIPGEKEEVVEENAEKVEEQVEETTEEVEEKPIIEKGSRPIRWAKSFIDKVRKNTSVEGISEKLQESIDKDTAGKTLSFKTVLYGKELKLAKAASSKWTQIKGWFKKDKEEAQEEQHVNDSEEKVEEQTIVNDPTTKEETTSSPTETIVNNENPYKKFLEIPQEQRVDVFNDVIQMLNEMQKDLIATNELVNKANETIKASEIALDKAARVTKEQNDKIEELSKNNNIINENAQQVDNNQGTNEDMVEKTEEKEETVDSRFQVYDAYKKQLDEQRAQEEKRRALEAEQEKLWNEELAPFIDNENFVQTAAEHAESVIETERQKYYNSVVIPDQQKREELLNQTRIDSLKNKINANAIKGTLTPEMINQLNNVFNNQDENENQPKTRK